MAEVVYEGTERKEPDGMTTGSSPSPALFTGFLLQVTSRQLENKGRDTDNKSFFFFKGKYWYIIMPMGTIPKEGNVDDAGKRVCDPEKGYHPESVQRCYLVAKIFHPFVTGLFLCPILVITIWRGSPVSQILDSKEPCLPTPAPLHCPGSGISTKLSGAFQGSLGWGEAGSH